MFVELKSGIIDTSDILIVYKIHYFKIEIMFYNHEPIYLTYEKESDLDSDLLKLKTVLMGELNAN